MAQPKIEAGYNERGLTSAVLADVVVPRLEGVRCDGVDVVASDVAGRSATVVLLEHGVGLVPAVLISCTTRRFSEVSKRSGFTVFLGMGKSHRPHAILPKAMRMAYTTPFQIMDPLNISVMGMEKPMDAYRQVSREKTSECQIVLTKKNGRNILSKGCL